ncbi:ABC transporter ATP-binding protein [Bacillus sp. NPDC077411]|uniref:ABC transporter ATP-binding protein n=1 Tax=Bacillus bruguierae TaxID=3127667 RepID=A0ABU8FD12_9BACI|nr:MULTISPECIES: ABC transporter ATP-binding protein [unclassified Bacillus (in: firmicutes)]SFI92028.1 spermidine/putrescine transport system ATP-binding protein [Bacillus sp. 71mf]SFS65920.1 spermidine/putrescine transport system ATP-binding protein [Bacillus sp. 103mf]
MKNIIKVEAVEKHFGNQVIIPPLSLDIKEGEFLTILGPSGCGKTTLLRMIAGFEKPTKGVISLDEETINDLPPYKRHMNLVFQHYALFPHMTVEKNIRFGLKMQKVSEAEQQERAEEAIRLTQLTEFRNRKPAKLSGGQQQRVAIARAIVNNPRVLLLDEPLGALDFKLRKDLQRELKNLQRNLGITFIYVTHDQEEAMSMSDRIVVMNKGHIEQIGTPKEIYHKPETLFVATFIGENNIIQTGENYVAVRPENVKVRSVEESSTEGYQFGHIEDIEFVGNMEKLYIRDEKTGELLMAYQSAEEAKQWNIGDNVYVGWEKEDEVTLN